MHHDTIPEPDGTTPRPATPAGDPMLSADAATPDRCTSVFDRWRCGRPQGHAGPHQAHVGGSTTTWNDPATGRRLRGR